MTSTSSSNSVSVDNEITENPWLSEEAQETTNINPYENNDGTDSAPDTPSPVATASREELLPSNSPVVLIDNNTTTQPRTDNIEEEPFTTVRRKKKDRKALANQNPDANRPAPYKKTQNGVYSF